MKEYRIYTAGKMGGLSFDEQMKWRLDAQELIVKPSEVKLHFFHPPLYYDPATSSLEEEYSTKQFDLAKLQESDIVLVNLDGIESSIGTVFEIATVEALNKNGNNIYMVGIGDKEKQHPWIRSAIPNIKKDISEACLFIHDFLLEE